VAVALEDGNGNDRLDEGDYIAFYAPAVASTYSKYSDSNVFWLTAGSSAERMATVNGAPSGGSLAASHTYTYRYELDQLYLPKAPGADGLDRWFFATYVPGSELNHAKAGQAIDYTFTLADVAAGLQGDLTIALFGQYGTTHEVDVAVNGTYVDTLSWDGIAMTTAALGTVDLVDGANTISLTCQSGLDSIAVDYFEVTYERQFQAESNTKLKFVHDSGFRYQITGFSEDDSADVFVYDISDPASVKQVSGLTLTGPDGSGKYTLCVQPDEAAGGEKTYLALSAAAVQTPTAIAADSGSTLGSAANGADYIIITSTAIGWENGARRSWLTGLAALRQAQGLRVQVVDVADIFDEFSYGIVTPLAIRDFVSHAYHNWVAPAPQYVLLVGDAAYDFKDNSGIGTDNPLPAYLTYTDYQGETVTDEYYVTVSGADAVPDLYIGRLPAQDAADAAVMVAKIIAYEGQSHKQAWWRNAVLVADNASEDWEAVFVSMNEDAAALLPAAMNAPAERYLDDYLDSSLDDTDLAVDLQADIDAGAVLVNYSGHGSLQAWGSEQFLTNALVDSWANGERYPFVVGMSCLTGFFAYAEAYYDLYSIEVQSLAEKLLRAAGKGAVAVLMPTGQTTTDGQHIFNTALYEAIFSEDTRELGAAIAAAKQELLANGDGYFEQISRTFLLFGDPAMQLKLPLPHRVQAVSGSRSDDGPITLSWQAALDCVDNAVAGYNVYRSSAGSGYVKCNSALVTELSYTDAAAAAGTAYYYVVTSVDEDGDESVYSQPVSLAAVQQAAADSGEDARVQSFVQRLYAQLLDRSADGGGLSDWSQALSDGTLSGPEIVAGFVNSAEFRAQTTSDAQYVGMLYRAVFGREPDAAGLSGWLALLAQGADRSAVLNGFVQSAEFRQLCEADGIAFDSNHAFIRRLYRLFLGRAPDDGGYAVWLQALTAQMRSGAEIARGFVLSAEFGAQNVDDEQYVRRLYRALLNREADAAGLAGWMALLQHGMARAAVLERFIQATEFADLCRSRGILAY